VKSTIEIELFEEYENVNFYTLRFPGEETEVDKFFYKFPEGCEYDKDIKIIIKWIEQIGARGAQERYFRPESRRSDDIWAIPIETASLRLYVIRLSSNIVILGNGGIKKTATYNEDPNLNECLELLQEINGYINARIRKQTITLYQNQIFGNTILHLKPRNEKE